jgi:hypothetical protein
MLIESQCDIPRVQWLGKDAGRCRETEDIESEEVKECVEGRKQEQREVELEGVLES